MGPERRLGRLRGHLAAPSAAHPPPVDARAAVAALEQWRAARRLELCREARALQAQPIFRHDPVLDVEAFERDGVWVLPGIFTEQATVRLVEACKEIQRHNDAWVSHDWLGCADEWAAAGLTPPLERPSPERMEHFLGGTQLGTRDSQDSDGLFPGSSFVGLRDDKRAPFLHGFCPESFVAGYSAFMLCVLTHPQMVNLQRQMLGSDDVRVDHDTVMNRKPGYPGQRWHAVRFHPHAHRHPINTRTTTAATLRFITLPLTGLAGWVLWGLSTPIRRMASARRRACRPSARPGICSTPRASRPQTTAG